jgi:lipopolysaccharide export system permease protein
MKKIDKLVVSSFLGPFLLTFLVVVFIFLMQHMLKYFDDIIGKDLGFGVLSTLLFYFAVFMTPVALPLAVLLSSLITFGNLGEHFELTAIKSLGVSLTRVIVPIFLLVLVITGIAFLANNYLVPKAALEAYSLLYDIKQKKPSLDLKEGAFYSAIPDVNIKVNKKYPDGETIEGVVIYDHRGRSGNMEVTVADSGRMYTIMGSKYLKLELFRGYNYSEGGGKEQEMTGQGRSKETFSKTKFSKTYVIYDLSEFALVRTDKKWFQGNRIMRNLEELEIDIDSVDLEMKQSRLAVFDNLTGTSTILAKSFVVGLPSELLIVRQQRDSLAIKGLRQNLSRGNYVKEDSAKKLRLEKSKSKSKSKFRTINKLRPVLTDSSKGLVKDSSKRLRAFSKNQKVDSLSDFSKALKVRTDTLKRSRPDSFKNLGIAYPTTPKVDSTITLNVDSLFQSKASAAEVSSSLATVRLAKSQILTSTESLKSQLHELNVFKIQWHKILANSAACIVMFLIGAPLGAIIKKGGLGVPVLISILFFIFYYIMSLTGEKWAKQNIVPPNIGIWASDAVLLIFGFVFLMQARVDARLFESDFYQVVMEKIRRRFNGKES